jgi:hypothetical protein
MRWLIGLAGAFLMVLMTGCEAEKGYGGAHGGVYGEYPYTYYGSSGYYPAPVYPYPGVRPRWHPAPYDRDHFLDRGRYWDGRGGEHWH